jgi:hypothetical protein
MISSAVDHAMSELIRILRMILFQFAVSILGKHINRVLRT